MNLIEEYVVSGALLSDSQLLEILRAQMLGEADRRGWLRRLELSLDPYRTPAQQVATKKIKSALHQLSTELSRSLLPQATDFSLSIASGDPPLHVRRAAPR